MMLIIGITGGSGAGKTSALRALQKLGALTIDCDAVYHELLRGCEGMKAELERFFPGVLQNGEIDRKKLGAIVFSDPFALLDLNEVTHKYVTNEVDRRCAEWESGGGTVAAIDAIALIESGRYEKCNVVVGITAPAADRVKRIAARDGIMPEDAQKRIDAQKPDEFFKENCGIILENVYNTAEEFEQKCESFFAEIIGGYTNAQ